MGGPFLPSLKPLEGAEIAAQGLRRLLLGQAGLDPRLLEGIIRMGAAY